MSQPQSRAPVIAASRLTVRFGEHQALHDLSFQVAEGSFVAIVGPNGSGKTTLLKVLTGLQEPSSGRVRVFGSRPENVPAGTVGYVPQIKTLDRSFPAQAIELVLSALHHRWPHRIDPDEREQAVEALKKVGAEELAHRPLGTLSGGELQRVYLARSLIRAPRLVLLDEPATGVDLVGAMDLYDLLETYQAEHNATVLMVTHDWNAAYHHATDVLVIDREQVSFGPPEEALDERCLRRAFGHVGHAHAMFASSGDADA